MLTGTVAKIHWQPRSEQSLCDHPLAGVAMVGNTACVVLFASQPVGGREMTRIMLKS